MKTVLLVRHAKTESPYTIKRDFDRRLTDSGQQDARRMGQWLWSSSFQIDRVISSSAERTRHTAQLICSEAGLQEEIQFKDELYHASPDVFTQVIRSIPDDVQTVMVVSHNEGITQFANQLTSARIDHMQPGSIFAVTSNCENWISFEDAEKEFLFYKQPGE